MSIDGLFTARDWHRLVGGRSVDQPPCFVRKRLLQRREQRLRAPVGCGGALAQENATMK